MPKTLIRRTKWQNQDKPYQLLRSQKRFHHVLLIRKETPGFLLHQTQPNKDPILSGGNGYLGIIVVNRTSNTLKIKFE